MNNKGFTVVEMIASMAVSATLLSVALSGMNSPKIQREADESEKVHQALIDARNAARFGIRCVTVDVGANSLTVTQWQSCTPVPTGTISTKTVTFNTNISLAPFDIANPLVFNAQGGTTAGASTTLTVSTASGRQYKYSVSPAIGTITSL